MTHLRCYFLPASTAPCRAYVAVSSPRRCDCPMLPFAQANVQRLKSYRSSLAIFPRRVNKPKVRHSPTGTEVTRAGVDSRGGGGGVLKVCCCGHARVSPLAPGVCSGVLYCLHGAWVPCSS